MNFEEIINKKIGCTTQLTKSKVGSTVECVLLLLFCISCLAFFDGRAFKKAQHRIASVCRVHLIDRPAGGKQKHPLEKQRTNDQPN